MAASSGRTRREGSAVLVEEPHRPGADLLQPDDLGPCGLAPHGIGKEFLAPCPRPSQSIQPATRRELRPNIQALHHWPPGQTLTGFGALNHGGLGPGRRRTGERSRDEA
jgi:hypothetical protein